ncbi:hypothetical protein TKK_0017121 [Trichogramma kaykai]
MRANEGSANPPPAAEKEEVTIVVNGQEFTYEFDLTLRCHEQEPSPPPGWQPLTCQLCGRPVNTPGPFLWEVLCSVFS